MAMPSGDVATLTGFIIIKSRCGGSVAVRAHRLPFASHFSTLKRWVTKAVLASLLFPTVLLARRLFALRCDWLYSDGQLLALKNSKLTKRSRPQQQCVNSSNTPSNP